ncbi:MAG TPA: isoprenylcysteine carboxylmethyltransferase family protein [Myxococcota bacterium]|nr:isoprenylcysteine carboxylmethyltransferase family protein [Myxococcota bacterium]
MRVPPPLVFAAILVAGWALDWLWPWPIVPPGRGFAPRIAGAAALIGLGFGLIACCVWHFKRAQTAVEPWRATTRIVTQGPYRYSRNPIYLGFALAGVGFALAFNNLWMLAGQLCFVLVVSELVIKREEAYLARKFGDAYSIYRSNTRRWL